MLGAIIGDVVGSRFEWHNYKGKDFDLFDSIINKEIDEDKIKNVLNKKNDYVLFLKNTFYYIIYTKKISLPYIEWIIRFQN